MAETMWVVFLSLLVLVILIKLLPIKNVVVYEYQKGLKYTNGRFVEALEKGSYWIFPAFSSILMIDIRPIFVTIPGQEVLSLDGVTLKVSLAVEYQVVDPDIAVNKNAAFQNSLYLQLQIALREIVGSEKIDALLENRTPIGPRLMELAGAKAGTLGIKILAASIKDLMVPGEMKRAFALVVKAQKEGQAALERARSETASLRSLANAAKMIEDNPNLLQLRALQMVADSTGNSVVFGVTPSTVVVKPSSPAKSGSGASATQD